jgi:hypothetical protein
MSNVLKYIIVILLVLSLSLLEVVAAQMDNGTNKNGKMVVSKTLSSRCGLSSNKPIVEMDCLKRLASDFIHNKEPLNNMTSTEEFNAILSDYMSAYLAFAAAQLNKSSTYKDDSDELAGKGISAVQNNDARADIEANNKLANDNSARLIDALDVRSMEININNIERMLDAVKGISQDIEKDSDEDKNLRTIPSIGGENG